MGRARRWLQAFKLMWKEFIFTNPG